MEPVCDYCSAGVAYPSIPEAHDYSCNDGCGNSPTKKCDHLSGSFKRDTRYWVHPNDKCDPELYPPPYPKRCTFKKCVAPFGIQCSLKACYYGKIYNRAKEICLKSGYSGCFCYPEEKCYNYRIKDRYNSNRDHSFEACWTQPCRVDCEYSLFNKKPQGEAREETLKAIRSIPGGINYEADLESLEKDTGFTLTE